jgi:hypothetical protein
MATQDITIDRIKDALQRMRNNLADANTTGCVNNATDLTRVSDFMNFDEGVFIGEILQSICDNFDDTVTLYDYKKEEIDPALKKIDVLIKFLENHFPPKNEKSKAELYDILVSTRFEVTKLQIAFEREKEPKKTPNPFERLH